MDDRGDSMEKGEALPLLDKSCLSGYSKEETSADDKEGSWLLCNLMKLDAPTIILGFECLESTAFFGISSNLVVYLRSIFHESTALSAANASIWAGTSFLAPLAGALVADTYWGNYKTALVSGFIYLFGLAFVTLTAFFPYLQPSSYEVRSVQEAGLASNIALFSGLYLVAIGSGGIKSALLPLGAEQFDEKDPKGKEKKGIFFHKFYICVTLGLLISSTFIVWIQENIDWAVGYGISTISIVIALGLFILATPTFKTRRPSGTPLKSIFQVLVSSFRKMRVEAPLDTSLLYEINENSSQNVGHQRLEHTDGFRFLDKAAVIPYSDLKDGRIYDSWHLCTVTQVEELKALLRLLPIWATGILFSAAYSQISTTFIQQGATMNNKVGTFSIPPASLSSIEVIFVMVWVLTCNRVVNPIARRCFKDGVGLSQLQRMGVGRFMIILTMITAGFVEYIRLKKAKTGTSMSIMWQLPQYFVLAASEVFNYISQLEFFYSQAPETMKSMCISLALLTVSLGSYMSSLIIALVSVITSRGGNQEWIPDDLNEGHLDYFYWGLGGLCTLNFFIYIIFARNYTLKKVISQY